MNNNTLFIVGSGIKFMSHITSEAKACIEQADKVFYLVNEPAMKQWIQNQNTCSESLDELYRKYPLRNDNYCSIAKHVVKSLEYIKNVCLVIYGHPTVFAQPSIYAANSATQKAINVIVMPGISAEACLLADLLIDPGSGGLQSFESTDFLIYKREYDSSSHLILWQPSVIGLLTQVQEHDPKKGLEILIKYLSQKYRFDHEVILYEAAQYPSMKPQIEHVKLRHLPSMKLTRLTTLYVPPNYQKKKDQKIISMLHEIN